MKQGLAPVLTGADRFFRSFSPGSRAAALAALPFTCVDAVHYYTAGTALALSLPVLLLLYTLCGALAAHFAQNEGQSPGEARRAGFGAGVKLWLCSTLTNVLISAAVGVASLGVTLLLGIPYLLLCAPVLLLAGGLCGLLGASLYLSARGRLGG